MDSAVLVFWLVLGTTHWYAGDSAVVVPVPYQNEQACLNAVNAVGPLKPGYQFQFAVCLPQPKADVSTWLAATANGPTQSYFNMNVAPPQPAK